MKKIFLDESEDESGIVSIIGRILLERIGEEYSDDSGGVNIFYKREGRGRGGRRRRGRRRRGRVRR